MAEQELAAIRKRWRGISAEDWTILGDSTTNDRLVVSVETDVPTSDAEAIYLAPRDIFALIKAVEERDAIIHDLTLDASTLSRRAVEEFAAGLWDWVNIERQRHQMTTDFDTGAACALGVVQARIDELRASGTAPDPLPPDQVRAENERLRERLRAIRCRVEDYLDTLGNCGGRWAGVEAALNRLREMASEEVTR